MYYFKQIKIRHENDREWGRRRRRKSDNTSVYKFTVSLSRKLELCSFKTRKRRRGKKGPKIIMFTNF